ncbi:MAG: MerR family transcriptional regulator [Nitrososphaerota archaeon]|jgi:DNA-binding transcriptional MerR regulator|nr:MerR family transcriptional regulator [Nitrososphaerota archaeon]
MSQTQTISTVSRILGVSSRTLRYYEQIGLIESQRMEDYAYRVYDDDAIRRLRQIIILRKLRVPVKQIREILCNNDAISVIEVFERNINELDEQITALSTVKSILSSLVYELYEKANVRLRLDYLGDSSVFAIVDKMVFPKNNLQEEQSMSDLNMANEQLNKLSDSDVRIVHLPASVVAGAIGIGDNAEDEADNIMGKFKDDVLINVSRSTRFYGFNNPEFSPDGEFIKHRYEVWATIPDDLPVPSPLIKKHFRGGLYIAYTSKPVSFDDWKKLKEWLDNNDEFEYDNSRAYRDDKLEYKMFGGSGWGNLEEHFNSYNIFGLKNKNHIITHIDFLVPVKER